MLRYLHGTVKCALKIKMDLNPSMMWYCDADWTGDREDKNATTGVLLQYRGAALSWRRSKQGIVAIFTTEADFVSLSDGVKLPMWLRRLIRELNGSQDGATTIC